MYTRADGLKILEASYRELSRLFPISAAYLYGSYARGDNTPYSDVDIMIVSPLTQEQLRRLHMTIAHISSELSMEHGVTVSLTVRSEAQFRPQQVPYYANVVKDGIKLQEADAV